jgi:hypothetical protein
MAGMSTHNKHLLGEKSVPENNDWLLPLPPGLICFAGLKACLAQGFR